MATSDLVPDRVDDLLLARIAHGAKLASNRALAADLHPLVPSTFDLARWTVVVDDALQRLGAAGRLDGLAIDPTEAMAVASRLGIAADTSWRVIRTRVLPRLAFGLPPADHKWIDRLANREAWAAAIVARSLGLWSQGKPPSATAVCDAVVWRALGLASKAKRSPPEVRAHFLVHTLDVGAGPPARLLAMLAARDIGSTRADLDALRDALVRRWLAGARWGAAAPIEAFASAVQASADLATDGVFAGRKVFISALWRGMRSRPPVGDMTLDEFKRQLVLAHRAGLIELARADLTAAMDPTTVHDSETAHLEARYHFVARGGPP